MKPTTTKEAAEKLGIPHVDLLMDLEDAGSPRDAEIAYDGFRVRIMWNPANLRVSYFEILKY